MTVSFVVFAKCVYTDFYLSSAVSSFGYKTGAPDYTHIFAIN